MRHSGCSGIPNFVLFLSAHQNTCPVVTVKPIVILSNRRKDGTYLVIIRVYFAGKVRRVQTSIVCRSEDLTRSGRIKAQSVLDTANKVAKRMLDAVSGYTDEQLAGKDVDWIVQKMKSADALHTFKLNFFTFADEVIASKNPSSRSQYVTACHTFAEYLGRREIDINDITKPLLADFVSWMSGKAFCFANGRLSPSERTRIPNGAESRNLAKLGHIFNKAKERFNDEDEGVILIPRSPFSGMMLKHPPSRGQKPLDVQTMQKVISSRHPLVTVQAALDVFVLSFALWGVNLADLYEARDVTDVWMYRRKKTRERRADGAEMRVTIPDCVKDRVARLQDGTKGWWLSVLHRMASKPQYITAKVNKGLARWCSDNDVPTFTFYAARHSFATLARNKAGVDKATVDECLCHIGDYKLTDIYLERDWSLLDDAGRKVLALFEWDLQTT